MVEPEMSVHSDWVKVVERFWFEELNPPQWFKKSDETDMLISERYSQLLNDVASTDIDELVADAATALSAVIVLDQFPRNMFRGTPRAFATDGKALVVAKKAVALGFDSGLGAAQRVFLYLPYEHSEDLADQDRAVQLISSIGDDSYTQYAEEHRKVIREFGRFPHRNEILGRRSTEAEEAFLATPGSGF